MKVTSQSGDAFIEYVWIIYTRIVRMQPFPWARAFHKRGATFDQSCAGAAARAAADILARRLASSRKRASAV